MKLTIVTEDSLVCENGVCYSGLVWQGTPNNVHALQWNDANPINENGVLYYGWIEFDDGSPNENIEVLPSWAVNAEAAWIVANTPVPPTPEQIKEQNKSAAVARLQSTDWAATVDIADPQYSNPYLANQDAFLAYRSEIRAIAVNPPSTIVDPWPAEPTAVWKPAP